MVIAIASAAGPSLAVSILSVASWHWLFIINIPFGILAFLMAYKYLPQNPPRDHRVKFDWVSGIANIIVFGAIFYAMGNFARWGDTMTNVLLLCCGVIVGERQNVVNQWSKPDGVIFLPDRQMEMPRQVGGMSGKPGAYSLLETELRLFEQTSGVEAAILGTSNDSSGIKGAEHYQAQVENATIALADIFRTFRALIQERDTKLQKL